MIKLAGKELGLTLIGTAIASDARQSYAILESTKTHSQDIYRESDSAGGMRLKRILRNNVIIAAADGGELRLSVDQQDPGGSRPSNLAARARGADGWTPARAVASNELPGRNASEVGRGTLNPEALARLKEVHDPDAAPAEGVLSDGLYVASLLSQTMMDKYGLYVGDMVKGVNGEEVTDPADAADLSKRISAGGPVSITIERRGRMQTLTLQQ